MRSQALLVACALRRMLDDVIQGVGESPGILNLLEYAAQNLPMESVSSSQGPSTERKVEQTEESVTTCAHSCAHYAKLMDIALWSGLPEELQELVFARLPSSQIYRVRLLSKGWNQKLMSGAKDSQFRRACASAQPKLFGLLEQRDFPGLFTVNMLDLALNRWHTFETSPRYYRKDFEVQGLCASDGGLVCFLSKAPSRKIPRDVFVCNPLTRVWKQLPPLYGINQQEIMVQLIMDRETKHYRVIVVGYCKDPKVRNWATVYHSETGQWTKADGSSSGEVVYGYLYDFPDRSGRAPCFYNFANGLVGEMATNFPGNHLDEFDLVKDHLFRLKEVELADRRLPPLCIEEYQAVHCGASWTLLKEYPFNRFLTGAPQHFQPHNLDRGTHFFACKDFLVLSTPNYLGEEPREENIRDFLWLYEFSTEEWRELPVMPGGNDFSLNQHQMFELRFDSVP